MMNFYIMSSVRSRIYCSHRQPFGAEVHGHWWDVWAFFPCGDVPIDGRQRQAALDELLCELSPDMNLALGDEATNEGLSRWVLDRMVQSGACAVHVLRAKEGLGAVAMKAAVAP